MAGNHSTKPAFHPNTGPGDNPDGGGIHFPRPKPSRLSLDTPARRRLCFPFRSILMASLVLSGVGSHAPSRILTNEDLSRTIDTTDEWIRTRTGIRERRVAGPSEATSDLAVGAARQALAASGLAAADIDLVIVATITPDKLFPSTACIVQAKLGLRPVPCFDVEAACSGFCYILEIAASLMRCGTYRHALIIGAEKMSSVVDWTDRSTCVLFGDGAGAAVLSKSDTPHVGLIGSILGADGRNGCVLEVPAGGSAKPATTETVAAKEHFLRMNGKEVFKFAVTVAEQVTREILEKHHIPASELALVIPHQANLRIISHMAEKLGIPEDRFVVNLERYGNTSAASIPLALDEALRAGRIRSGDLILLVAFGAGLTWAANLIRWP